MSRSQLIVAQAMAAKLQRERDEARAGLAAEKATSAQLSAFCERQNASVIAAQDRIAALTDQMLTMKRQGFEPQPVQPEYAEPVGMDPGVYAAITKIAAPRTPMFNQLARFAEAQLALGVDAGQVIKQVRRGADTDSLEADVEEMLV